MQEPVQVTRDHSGAARLYTDLATELECQLTTACTNQTTGLTNSRAANCTLEVVSSPFHALSRYQLTFPFCC